MLTFLKLLWKCHDAILIPWTYWDINQTNQWLYSRRLRPTPGHIISNRTRTSARTLLPVKVLHHLCLLTFKYHAFREILTRSLLLWMSSKKTAWLWPPSLGFSRQEHWSGLPFPSPMPQSEVAQSCPTPSDPMECSLPGSSVHGILQARVLEWSAIAFSTLYI